ncbi:SusC/RagA family TonB-linked outer membrane protein [Elizabethkingia sp. JS20170427COW]|uniref:SusC/RagA family TonB-linked outer membrane protein n=1 Tax=Elizabethkingia sp. JS20170427COW TaxID=2583851 RepID=UPI0011103B96|nr:SusC/RagA family TonB-linked outer membrane protein [Elizabethkingia sp. JS20170427COW]QCX52806.1 SusC/RagA family TonB-linked outer membrane protein [Elizabethkingia sp. JS20170427COW]
MGRKLTSTSGCFKVAIAFFVGISSVQMAVAQTGKKADSTKTKEIEEVVMVGYGKQKKMNLTTAVSTISKETLENRAVPTVANMIQGAAPGLVVTRSSGRVSGQGLNLEIRGATSASGTVAPLIVIDGVVSQTSTFTSLNPNDIESISVLKDGGATAIYGAQSAGGVILVTTKRGKSGKARISLSSNSAFSMPSNLPKRLSLIDEMEYVNLARENAGLSPEYTDTDLQYARDGVEFVLDPTTNLWKTYNQKSIIKQTFREVYPLINNNLQVTGGSDRITYMASIGNMQQSGIIKVGDDFFSRWNGRVNFTAKVNDYVKIEINSAYTSEAVNNPQDGGYGLEGGGNGIFRQLYNSRLRFPIFNPDGSYYISGTSSAFGYALLRDGGFNQDRKENFLNNITATISNIAKGLDFKLVYGRETKNTENRNFRRTVDYYAGPGANSLKQLNNPNNYSVANTKTIIENAQAIVNYAYKLQNHNFHIMGGYQLQKYRYSSLSASTKNLFVNDNPSLGFTSDPLNKSHSESISSDIMQSFFGRFNYDYQGKYLFEATIRSDESSRLTSGNRIKVFPSFSLGWNVAKENWFESISSILNEFKPRASWAKVGSNIGIGYYDYIAQLSTGSNLLLGNSKYTYVYQNKLPAEILGWETIETQNIGADFALFNRKLTGSFDYFNKYNNNMLVPITLPETVGINVPKQNAGKLKTWGWELSLSYNDKVGSDFSYRITANLADNQNRLLKYDGASNIVYSGVNGLVEGYALNSIWAYKSDGYFQNANELINAPSYAKLLNKAGVPGVGDVRYIDINRDGEISAGKNTLDDHGDLVYMGDLNPRYQFGLNVAMNYKNIDFSFFIQGIGKRNFKPSNELIQPQLYSWYLPMSFQMDYWTPDNPNAAFPRPYISGNHNYVNSDKWFLNGAYARLKNVQIGYSISKEALKGSPISRFRIYASAEDILTFSKFPKAFKGVLDPEQPNGAVAGYPFAKTVSIGVNIDF